MLQPANPLQPIFIVGYLHSGTTLLQRILGLNQTIFTGKGETRFFVYLPLIRQKFPHLALDGQLRHYVTWLVRVILTGYVTANLAPSTNSPLPLAEFGLPNDLVERIMATAPQPYEHVALFRIAHELMTLAVGKSCWLEKTPAHLMQLEQIMSALPTARVIELVRDPRDILVSKQARHSGEGPHRSEAVEHSSARLQGGFDPLWDTLAWRTTVQAGNLAQQKFAHRVLRMQYEQLVSAPEQEVQRICTFLGIPLSIDMLNVFWINTSIQVKQGSRGIGTESVEKWKKQLSPAMITLCQAVARKEMTSLGYSLAPSTVAATAHLPWLLGRSGVEFMGRLYRRWRWGGLAFLRGELASYWSRLLNTKQQPF
jgi:hypothetical protein